MLLHYLTPLLMLHYHIHWRCVFSINHVRIAFLIPPCKGRDREPRDPHAGTLTFPLPFARRCGRTVCSPCRNGEVAINLVRRGCKRTEIACCLALGSRTVPCETCLTRSLSKQISRFRTQRRSFPWRRLAIAVRETSTSWPRPSPPPAGTCERFNRAQHTPPRPTPILRPPLASARHLIRPAIVLGNNAARV